MLVLTDERYKYLIKKNAVEYSSFLSLEGTRQWLHPIRYISYITKATEKFIRYLVVISLFSVYSLIQVIVWDISLAAFHGCQHMVNVIYSCFSVILYIFPSRMVALLGTGINRVLKTCFTNKFQDQFYQSILDKSLGISS